MPVGERCRKAVCGRTARTGQAAEGAKVNQGPLYGTRFAVAAGWCPGRHGSAMRQMRAQVDAYCRSSGPVVYGMPYFSNSSRTRGAIWA